MKLQFSKDRGRIKIDKRSDKDEILCRYTSTYSTDDHFKKGAVALSIPVDILMHYVDKFEKSKLNTEEYELQLNPLDVFTIRIRGLEEEESKAKVYNDINPLKCLQSALSDDSYSSNSQPILYWDNTKHLAAVDIDVKDGSVIDLKAVLSTFNPCPSMAWNTHGGGLRLIYTAQDIFTAEELAALAIYTISFTLEYSNLELKCNTRHPMYKKGTAECGEVFCYNQDTDISSLMKFLRKFTVDDTDVIEWLESNNYEKGKRYPHNKCPVDPSNTGKTDCVLIGDKGIKCYICEAHGVIYGSHKPGFFPYSAFIKNSENTLLYKCVKNYTHFAHAQYILSSRFNITGPFSPLCYTGLLKAINNAYDTRVQDAIYRGTNFIRISNQWATKSGDIYSKDLKPLLSTLPACQIITKKGSVLVDNEKLTMFQQTHDLSDYGYPSLTPIWGCKVGSYYMEGELNNKIFAVMQKTLFTSDTMHLAPKYEEGNLEKAWTVIEKLFPGVNRNLVHLLIAARGCIELEYGLPPFIFITGVTGAGKTSTIQLAAGMLGDSVSDIVWVNNIERVREAILTEKHSGSFIAFNEMIKESRNKKASPTAALDFLLNLTKNSSSWQAYVGPVKLGTLPVIIFTDTDLPIEVKQDKQLARRIVHVHLPSAVEWIETIRRYGLSDISSIRLLSPAIASACNVILTHTINSYFKSLYTFFDIAEQLNCKTLLLSEESEDFDKILQTFYLKVCKAPKLAGSDAIRWSGRGWKQVTKNEKSELLALWQEICDNSEIGFTTSRRCEEVDWQKIMKAKEPIKFELRAHGSSKVAFRFRSVTGTKIDYRVNEELL